MVDYGIIILLTDFYPKRYNLSVVPPFISLRFSRARSSVAERGAHNLSVAGSIPAEPIYG
jgi:hypothetical protein